MLRRKANPAQKKCTKKTAGKNILKIKREKLWIIKN